VGHILFVTFYKHIKINFKITKMKNLKLFVILLISIIVISCSNNDDTPETTIVVKDFETTIDENPVTGHRLGVIETTTNQGTLIYAIKIEEPTGAFTIDPKTGKLTVKDAALFDYETRKTLTATVQVKNEGLSKETKVTVTLNNVIENNKNIVFSDINFKNALLAHTDPIIDTNKDGEISMEEAKVVTKMSIVNKNIEDISEIEYFAALTSLSCPDNRIIVLDISKNTALTTLICYKNELIDLNMKNGNNHAFKTVSIKENSLLNCVEVDNPTAPYLEKWSKDKTTSYAIECPW
jgi:Leucine-rich repeat (LRR) protein